MDSPNNRLRAHIDNLPLAYIEYDHNMRVRTWSDRAEEIFGWKASEVIGLHPLEWKFIYEEDQEPVDQLFKEITSGGTTRATLTNRNYTKSGRILWVDWYTSVLTRADGGFDIVTISVDVTDRFESELRLSSTFNQAPVGIAYVDLEGKWLMANPRLCHDLGAPSTYWSSFFDIFSKNDRAQIVAQFGHLSAGSISRLSLQTRALSTKGNEFWVELTLSVVRNSSDQPHYVVAVVEDIHHRRVAESEQRKLTSLVENSNDFIAVMSSDYKVIYLNRAGRELAGHFEIPPSPDIFDLLDPGTEELSNIRLALTQNGHWQGELEVPSAGTKLRIAALANFFVIRDRSQGGVEYIACIARDITENKAAERAQREYQQKLERTVQERMTELRQAYRILFEQQQMLVHAAKMSALGEMAGTIAHEINSPLTVITMKANQLERMAHSGQTHLEKISAEASAISKTALRIGNIIKGLRVYSREGEKDPFENSFVGSIVEDTLALCRLRFENYGIQLEVSELPQSAWIECRPVQVGQVLLNLLNNAFDAIRELDEKWVRIDVEDLGEMICMSVTDSGRGIPQEFREKLMLPFFTTKGAGEGTGLGLSISQEIVHAHRGVIYIDYSHLHTRFVIHWPKKQSYSLR